MRTRSSSNLVGNSSSNPTTSNPKRRNRRRSNQRVESFALEESPVVTMADQRTMTELLRAPTEGYAEAIMGELKSHYHRSGIVLDGPTIPMPPPFINPEEDERVEETITDPEHVKWDSIPQEIRLIKSKITSDDYLGKSKSKIIKILIDELDPSRSSDFLPFPECDSVFYEDFSEVMICLSPTKEDKILSSIYELFFHKEVPGLGALLSFSSKNEENIFNPGILTSKRVHTSLLPELSHRGTKAFKVIKILESPMEIFPCSYGEYIRVLDVSFSQCFYPLNQLKDFISKDIEDPSWSTSFKTRRTQKTSSALEALWKTLFVLYLYLIGTLPHGRMILAFVQKGPLVWPSITVDGVTRLEEYTKLTPAEAIQADCNIKAINIILQGLPTEIYALVSQHRVAKDLWDKIKLLMQGTLLTKQERECKLYEEFDKFTYKKGESLHEYYLRFTLLLND
ncbi:hypothetical protein Tco_0425394, partial [Tanacetum coccineum]